MIELKLFNNLDICEKQWKTFERNSNFTFFQSFNYIKNLTNIENNQLRVIFVYFNQELIAIYPLEIRKFFGIKILQWIGSNKSDYCNPIVSNKFIRIIDENKFKFIWNQVLKKIKDFDIIFLNNQPSNIHESKNPFVKFLENIKQTKNYKTLLLDNYNEYLKSIKNKDKKHAYELHRVNIKYKKLKQFYKTDININQIDFTSNDLDLIFFNKQNQLKLKRNKHYLDNSFLSIFKNLLKEKNENFFLAKLSIDKEIVGKCFVIIFRNYLYYYMPVMISNKYNKYKPGKILLLHIIQWAINKKIIFLDFGLGDENYKKHFSNNISFVQKYLSYFSFKGKLIFIICKLIIFLGY